MLRNTLMRAAAVALVCAAVTATPAAAQSPRKPADDTQKVAVEPIECWWRTGASAVRVGELFSVILTCAVLDTSATTVIPDQSRLDPTVLQLPPFEVTGGTQPSDLHTPSRRFFQYEYTLRYIGEDFGRDVPLPTLAVSYRVQSRVESDAAAIESRDRQYVLPSLLIRVESLVPVNAADIRDRPPDTFRGIEARRLRGTVLRILSLALFGLSAVVLIWTLLRAIGHRRARSGAAPRHASDRAILGEVARRLDAIGRQRHVDGWTPELAASALAPLRIAGAYATTGHVAQSPWNGRAEPTEGQLVVRSPFRPGRAAVVSGSATAGTIAREMGRLATLNGHHAGPLPDLHAALSAMNAAAYGRTSAELDLDDAFAGGVRGVSAVRRSRRWMALRLGALRRSADGGRTGTWAR